jgi:hypothetical protein
LVGSSKTENPPLDHFISIIALQDCDFLLSFNFSFFYVCEVCFSTRMFLEVPVISGLMYSFMYAIIVFYVNSFCYCYWCSLLKCLDFGRPEQN